MNDTVKIDKDKLIDAVGGSVAMAGFLLEQVTLFEKHFKQYRKDVISSSTSSAMRLHQQSGRRMSDRLPYGWKADPDDPARMLPDEAERKAIEWMVQLRAEGLSLRKIGETLETAGMPPRPKDDGTPKHWAPVVIHRILLRELKSQKLGETAKYK